MKRAVKIARYIAGCLVIGLIVSVSAGLLGIHLTFGQMVAFLAAVWIGDALCEVIAGK